MIRPEKPAPADPPIEALLAARWSPRAFLDRGLTRGEVHRLLEAARWAPSAFNEQPWRFFVARREEGARHAALASLLNESNRRWAERAPLLLIGAAATRFARNGRANRHALYDLGQAVAGMSVQATAMGLGVHQMAGFDRERAEASLELPEGFEAVVAIAVGWPGEAESLPGDLAERERAPRRRRPLEETAFGGRFGEPW